MKQPSGNHVETSLALSANKVRSKSNTKKQIVLTKLGRKRGASIAELSSVTGWQSHSIRSLISDLRKSGTHISRSRTASGTTRYSCAGSA